MPTPAKRGSIRITFHSTNAVRILADDPLLEFGGAEMQIIGLASGLKDPFTASFLAGITRDDFQVKGFPVFCGWELGRDQSMQGRFRAVMAWWKTFRRARPDVVYHRCGDPLLPILVAFAWLANVPIIHHVASDAELTDGSPALVPLEFRLFRFGLLFVDAIIVQTNSQGRALGRSQRRPRFLVHNGIHLPALVESTRKGFLWIGSLREVKDPHSILDLAEALPDSHFTLIGSVRDATGTSALRRLGGIANVEHVEAVPHSTILERLTQVHGLINTSHLEGFSNTFLEAWAVATPVFSLRVDPDGIIAKNGLGSLYTSVDRMASGLQSLLGDPARLRKLGEAGRTYVEQQHSFPNVNQKFNVVLNKVLDRRMKQHPGGRT